jgi:hypothetical protein
LICQYISAIIFHPNSSFFYRNILRIKIQQKSPPTFREAIKNRINEKLFSRWNLEKSERPQESERRRKERKYGKADNPNNAIKAIFG